MVWGATGYTGRLVARCVAQRAPARLRWAIGGRDRARLEALRSSLGASVDLVVGDAHDDAALAAMARRSKAIVSTVGPFARHGTPLVAACASAGTDYADISGEPTWMRRSIDAFHERARDTGARIVHACGFDSVPSDLGTWLLQRAARERYGRPCNDVTHVFGPLSGGMSGGSIATSVGMIAEAARDPSARAALADPDLLAPGAEPSVGTADTWWPKRNASLGGWTAPFPMARVNTKIVRRTRALLDEPWGTDFSYRERLRAPNWITAASIGAVTALGPQLLRIPKLRDLTLRLAPKPGAGPSEAQRARGHFRTSLVGRAGDAPNPVVVRVQSDHDPGYGSASRMLAEMGLVLAQAETEAPGGVATPAVAGGAAFLERLGEVGIRFRADS